MKIFIFQANSIFARRVALFVRTLAEPNGKIFAFNPAPLLFFATRTSPASHSLGTLPKEEGLPEFSYPRLRGLNRHKFLPNKSDNASIPILVSFSIFAVLFEAAKARFLLSDSRVRISRCQASALARDIAGYLGAAAPKRLFFGSLLWGVPKK
ncbi:MAG: hypothetical protein IJW97_03175 [Clostridia bacterium]|nr:hypothetical protein [Clostridia bacterium]